MNDEAELLDGIGEVLGAMMDQGSRYIQMYYAAYLEVTKLPPEEVCLVHWKNNGVSVWQLATEEEAYKILNGEIEDES